jgi:hypothetical protein
MKSKFIIALFSVLIMSSSCKNNGKTEDETAAEKPAVKENFSVEIDVKASKKDDFSLYYTEDNTIAFSGDMALWRGVTGGNIQEKIIFDLPEEKLPTDIRLDFGMNKDQETVEVLNVKIIFYGKELNIKGSDFFKYFIESKDFDTSIDVAAGSMKIKRKGTEYKTPFFDPRQELIEAIKNLTVK